jgi:heme-degrading monooxygenase HmoA
MIVQIVRFKSRLPESGVFATYQERAPRYRALEGLLQKYYLRFPETGEYGAVYLWKSEAALTEFRQSELGRSISEAYQVEGVPELHRAEVVMTLRADRWAPDHG